MNEADIRDTFEFEEQLASLLLKEKWAIPLKGLKFTLSAKSFAKRDGFICISLPTWEHSRDFAALREEIRFLFTDLHTNFQRRHKFLWQRIARQLNAIEDIKADDACECELCGQIGPLTTTQRCVPCFKLERAIEANPKLAAQILNRIMEGDNSGTSDS